MRSNSSSVIGHAHRAGRVERRQAPAIDHDVRLRCRSSPRQARRPPGAEHFEVRALRGDERQRAVVGDDVNDDRAEHAARRPPRPSQIDRVGVQHAALLWRRNGATSPNTSHWSHDVVVPPRGCVETAYSGRFSGKRLMSAPDASYNSTADVSRSRASTVCRQIGERRVRPRRAVGRRVDVAQTAPPAAVRRSRRRVGCEPILQRRGRVSALQARNASR